MSNFDIIFFLQLIVFHFVLFGYYLLDVYSFLLRNRKVLDQERMGGGEEQEGVVGGEAIIKKYMRKYFFQILKIKRRKDLKEKKWDIHSPGNPGILFTETLYSTVQS